MKFIPKNIEYLLSGTARQKNAYIAISELGILKDLEKFNPTLAGTIPLDIDTDASDLDIICQSSNLVEFEALVKKLYKSMRNFKSHIINIRDIPSFVSTFEESNFTFEIFCQSIPVKKQYAFIHLNIEARLLKLAGPLARDRIRQLKQQGIKTEPAFAMYFNIAGDSYEELAKLAACTDEQLQNLFLKGFS